MSTYLWIGAAWLVVTTAAVLCVRDVHSLMMDDQEVVPDAAAALGA
jgi:hypothetical protein